jgi:CubicO group peptidase (beta-lactamase class C family)
MDQRSEYGRGSAPDEHASTPLSRRYQVSILQLELCRAWIAGEKVSGQSYAAYVVEHVFRPLNMYHSYTSHAVALTHDLAEGHYYMLGRAHPREGVFPPAYLPTGLLIASAEDLTHYAIAQLNAGRYGDTSVLSPQSMAELHTPAVLMMAQNYYAMDWAVGPLESITTIRHSGDIGVSHGEIMFQPESGWASSC